MSDCGHIWCAETEPPEFQVNRQLSPEPLVYVRCERCGARTWFTEAQWSELDEEPEEGTRL